MINQYIKTIYCLLFLGIASTVYSQKWVNNEMTEYFRDKTIYDMSVNEGVVWVSSDGVIRAEGDDFKVYNFNFLFENGELPDFESKFPIENNFKEIKSKGNATYLYDGDKNFIKIENDYVWNIEFPFDYHKYTTEFETDEQGRLWVLNSNQGAKYSESNIYYYDRDKIHRLDIEMQDMKPTGIAFSTDHQFLLMLGPMSSMDRHMELWKISFDTIINKIILDGGDFLESDEMNIYIKGHRELSILEKRQSLDSIKKIKLPLKDVHSLYYKVIGDWIYLSTDEYLRRYNYTNDSLEDIKTNYDTEEYYFKNLFMYKDSLIIGQNGSHKEIFDKYGKGVKILKIKSSP